MESDEIDRRSVLAALGTVGGSLALAGCIDSFNSAPRNDESEQEPSTTDDSESAPTRDSDVPDECPKSTLPFGLPDEVTRERAEAFVTDYEEEYVERNYDIQHARDSAGTSVIESTPTASGYTVSLEVGGFNFRTDVTLDARVVEGTVEAPSVTEFDSEILRETAREAVEADGPATRSWTGASMEDAVPDDVHEAYTSLPVADASHVVTVGNATVGLEIHLIRGGGPALNERRACDAQSEAQASRARRIAWNGVPRTMRAGKARAQKPTLSTTNLGLLQVTVSRPDFFTGAHETPDARLGGHKSRRGGAQVNRPLMPGPSLGHRQLKRECRRLPESVQGGGETLSVRYSGRMTRLQ